MLRALNTSPGAKCDANANGSPSIAASCALYVLDLGWLEVKNGRERVHAGTGQVFRVVPVPQTAPSERQAGDSAEDSAGDASGPAGGNQ